MSGASRIHIAGHAIVNRAYPHLSRLVLASDRDPSGLTPAAISNATLSKAPVVVLSACDTAAGRVFRSEGALSLARPFLLAGASVVLATLRPLPDAVGPHLAADVHSAIATGRPAAEALAEWQRMAHRQGVPMAQWSLFIAIGGLPPRLVPSFP
jgi:CHAT domain-containing protein